MQHKKTMTAYNKLVRDSIPEMLDGKNIPYDLKGD